MNIVSSRTLFTGQTDRRTFAFLELLTEPKISPLNATCNVSTQDVQKKSNYPLVVIPSICKMTSYLNGLDSVGEVGKEPGLWPPLEAGSCSLDLGLVILKSSLRSDTAAPWLVRSGGLALKQLLPRKFSDELFFMLMLFWGFVEYHWIRTRLVVSQVYHRWNKMQSFDLLICHHRSHLKANHPEL